MARASTASSARRSAATAASTSNPASAGTSTWARATISATSCSSSSSGTGTSTTLPMLWRNSSFTKTWEHKEAPPAALRGCLAVRRRGSLVAGHAGEPAVVQLPSHGDRGGGAAPVFGHDQVGLPVPRRVLIGIWLVDEDDDVRVLLDRPGLAQIAQLGFFVEALLRPTVELGQRHDRHPQLLGQQLQAAGELGDFLLAGLHPLA